MGRGLNGLFRGRSWATVASIAGGVAVLLAIAASVMAQQQGTFTVLHSFTGPPNDGRNPLTDLTLDSSGNLYGTTQMGGTVNAGTAFVVRPDGTEAVLHSFSGGAIDGTDPSGLTLGADGNFYGTAAGGASGNGLVFTMTPEGAVAVLYSFAGSPADGSFPVSGVIRDSAGNLYGTTVYGGAFPCFGSGCGTVFKLSPDGTETVLYSFAGGPNDGANPEGGLIQDSAGNLYGTTYNGGTPGNGTVFKISADGTETVLYSFAGPANNGGSSTGPPNDGSGPYAGLIMDASGNLYGTTLNGGAYSGGTLFKLSPAGAETLLHNFGGTSDGRSPFGGLVMDSAGNLYGTAGVVFELSPDGTYTVLHYFAPSEGGGPGPYATLVQDGARNLYGTTYGEPPSPCSVEGPGGCGIVFKLRPPTADLIIHSLAPTVIPSGATLTYTIAVTNNGPDTANNVSIQDMIPAGTTFNSVSVSAGSCTAPAPGGTGTVTCTAPSLANNGVITEVLTVSVTAAMGSAVMDTATVSSSTYDPFPGNNSATITTTVI